MSDQEDASFLFACQLDGNGGAIPVDWNDVKAWKPTDGPLWVHLDRTDEEVLQWLREESGLTAFTVEAITAEETRPRVFRGESGYITILRGVNRNDDSAADNLVSVRLWCDGKRLVSLRHRRLFVPRALYSELIDEGSGPATLPELFEHIISRLVLQMGSLVSQFDDRLDTIEIEVENANPADTRRELGEIRREVIEVRQFLAPQREALSAMVADPLKWLPDELRPALREVMDRQQRMVEELDALRERAHVIKDDISNQLNETMNRNMYVISVMAAIFLPLSFLTGLLGINVGGMPSVENNWAFAITCAIMAVLLIIEVWLFRKLKCM